MKYTTKSGKTVSVKSVRNDKRAPWEPYGNGYIITLSVSGKRASFQFWDSVSNQQNGKDCDLRGALACFASDALIGKNASDVLDIMDEFGYDDTKEARRVFSGVKRAESQSLRLGLDWDELSEIADY